MREREREEEDDEDRETKKKTHYSNSTLTDCLHNLSLNFAKAPAELDPFRKVKVTLPCGHEATAA